MKKDVEVTKAKRVRREFTPLHFMPQRLNEKPGQYVLLGIDQNSRLLAKILSHKEAVAFVKGDHPDKRIPVDENPDHDIVYVWNDALNEYVPQS